MQVFSKKEGVDKVEQEWRRVLKYFWGQCWDQRVTSFVANVYKFLSSNNTKNIGILDQYMQQHCNVFPKNLAP
jgi:hypothetical protein